MRRYFRFWRWYSWRAPVVSLMLALPAMASDSSFEIANPANFASLSLSPGFVSQTVKGYTNGVIALHRIVGERDIHQNMCLGYGSPSPDHRLVLKKNINQIKVKVNSQQDTTLLIKGPENRLYCLDDSAQGKDADWSPENLPIGNYSIWVGSFERGQQFRYTVTVEEL